eukprot:gene22922-27713_t
MSSTILLDVKDRVATITFKRGKYNQFTEEETAQVNAALRHCADSNEVGAVILTGSGKYYSAGADFSSSLNLRLPKTMREHVARYNESVFNAYITFPKPIIAAVNGPAVGMAVTTASLTDVILAAPSASFHTPFVHIGLPPEGCSSFNFARIMGEENAAVLLKEGRKIDAQTALQFGFVKEVVPEPGLLERATQVAHDLMQNQPQRPIIRDNLVKKLQQVNAEESIALGQAVLEKPFLQANAKNATAKGDTATAWAFWGLLTMYPLISRL